MIFPVCCYLTVHHLAMKVWFVCVGVHIKLWQIGNPCRKDKLELNMNALLLILLSPEWGR